MSKIKTGLIVVATLLFANTIMAQSLEDGKKLFFNEKYISAKKVFSQIANNTDATYWLGQSEIALEDIAGAKNLYQQALMAAPNTPLLIAGMGHIELIEGKLQDARQRFETAISLSQSKNIAVLNAIGFANVDVKAGDADYAIDKLKQAVALKGMKDPDVYINLGDAYKKNVDGGSAQTAYENALNLNKNYARASYKIGKIYLTQGAMQEDIFTRYFNDAIAKDASFAPVYRSLYEFNYSGNVTKSADYLNKYLALMGEDEPNGCYFNASMKFAQKLFADAISESDKCIAASTTPFPNLYGLKAYAYDRLGDSVNAKASFDEYFKRQKTEKIGVGDYSAYANVLLKFPGNDSIAGTYIDKAIAASPTPKEKADQMLKTAKLFEGQKKYKYAGDWYYKTTALAQSTTSDYYNKAGYNYYRAGDYQNAIMSFNIAGQKFPQEMYSFYMNGKSNWAIDTTMTLGMANPLFEKAIQVGETDTAKNKSQLIISYKYFVAYYANVKKDKETAIAYCDKILALDPTDTEAINNKAVLTAMKTKPAIVAPKTSAKPAPKTPAPKTPKKK